MMNSLPDLVQQKIAHQVFCSEYSQALRNPTPSLSTIQKEFLLLRAEPSQVAHLATTLQITSRSLAEICVVRCVSNHLNDMVLDEQYLNKFLQQVITTRTTIRDLVDLAPQKLDTRTAIKRTLQIADKAAPSPQIINQLTHVELFITLLLTNPYEVAYFVKNYTAPIKDLPTIEVILERARPSTLESIAAALAPYSAPLKHVVLRRTSPTSYPITKLAELTRARIGLLSFKEQYNYLSPCELDPRRVSTLLFAQTNRLANVCDLFPVEKHVKNDWQLALAWVSICEQIEDKVRIVRACANHTHQFMEYLVLGAHQVDLETICAAIHHPDESIIQMALYRSNVPEYLVKLWHTYMTDETYWIALAKASPSKIRQIYEQVVNPTSYHRRVALIRAESTDRRTIYSTLNSPSFEEYAINATLDSF